MFHPQERAREPQIVRAGNGVGFHGVENHQHRTPDVGGRFYNQQHEVSRAPYGNDLSRGNHHRGSSREARGGGGGVVVDTANDGEVGKNGDGVDAVTGTEDGSKDVENREAWVMAGAGTEEGSEGSWGGVRGTGVGKKVGRRGVSLRLPTLLRGLSDFPIWKN